MPVEVLVLLLLWNHPGCLIAPSCWTNRYNFSSQISYTWWLPCLHLRNNSYVVMMCQAAVLSILCILNNLMRTVLGRLCTEAEDKWPAESLCRKHTLGSDAGARSRLPSQLLRSLLSELSTQRVKSWHLCLLDSALAYSFLLCVRN